MNLLELYLYKLQEIQTPKGYTLIIRKNDLEAPLFKWRTRLAHDLYGKFCENKPCSMITYSWMYNNKCIGGMSIIENPKLNQTKNYKVNCEIVFLFVGEEHRGLNLGGLLIKDVITKYKKIFLITDKRSSDIAKIMYKKYGFKEVDKEGTLHYWIK
jgi:ribosomal protein S18 acetylase RimI-like enzyme